MAGAEPNRLDAERLDVLRRWGRGLGDDPRDEVRAAGRAIAMLIEEIERLHIELWHTRVVVQVEDPADQEVDEPAPEPQDASVDNMGAALLGRVRGLFTPRRAAGGHRHE